MKIKRLSGKTFLCLILALFMLTLTAAVPAKAATSEVKTNVRTVAISKGETFELKLYNTTDNQTVSFSSEDEQIASVDEGGMITGYACGSTVIKVVIRDEADKTVSSFNVDVTVGIPAISVKFVKSEIEMPVGSRRILKTLLYPQNTSEKPVYYSDDRTVATISSTGRITAKSVGETYVYVFLGNGTYDMCLVYVTEIDQPEETVPENTSPAGSADPIFF